MIKHRAMLTVFVAFALSITASSIRAQQIAFTWDDLPAHSALPAGETRTEIGHKLIVAMQEAHLPPVYGFVNAVQLQREPASAPMLKEWRDAGFLLGNHTWSHMNLNSSSLADWEADLLKDEPTLQQYATGSDWHWLRFPYLAEGNSEEIRSEARKFLAAHDYKIAAVTMSFGDYMWNEPYARCVAKSDSSAIAQLESSYLDAAAAEADFRRSTSKAVYGRDVPYVLLMHVGAFDARMLPRLLSLYREKGFTFVTLEDAEKDPFYKSSIDLSLPVLSDNAKTQPQGKALPTHPVLALDPNSLCR
jgi:peptidoglycan/xylan/chitin deacetylase (PgdA/CDA1 family)